MIDSNEGFHIFRYSFRKTFLLVNDIHRDYINLIPWTNVFLKDDIGFVGIFSQFLSILFGTKFNSFLIVTEVITMQTVDSVKPKVKYSFQYLIQITTAFIVGFLPAHIVKENRNQKYEERVCSSTKPKKYKIFKSEQTLSSMEKTLIIYWCIHKR